VTATATPADPPRRAALREAGGPRLSDRLSAGVLILPGVVWLMILFLLPLGIMAVISLGSVDAGGHVTLAQPGLENYQQAFRPEYFPAFVRSLYYAGAATVLSLGIGYPVAYWISRHGGRRKILLLILVMLPFWTSYLIRTYSWMIVLRDNGVVNSLLQALGLTSQPIILMNTELSVILGMTYGFLPFAILPLFVSIDRLDPSLVAAARDLYATGRSAFVNVTLPLTMPGIVAAGLLTFIPAIGDFVTPDLLGGPETTTIAKNIQVLFLANRDWPYGAALGFVLMVVTLAGTLVAIRTLRREVVGS
jgi:spermidine/putrescine transport system permease protein